MMTPGVAKERIQKMIAHLSIEEQMKLIAEISVGLHKKASQHLLIKSNAHTTGQCYQR